MAKDLFENIGKKITKVTGEAVNKTEDFFTVTKIKGRMAEEDRMIAQICRKIGREVYEEYKNGQVFSEVIVELCKDIERHEEEKKNQEKDLALFKETKNEEEDIFEAEEE